MLNEFIDYNLEPEIAWAKKYNEPIDRGDLLIEYGINMLGNLDTEVYSFSWWARATVKPNDRYFPIFIKQRYSGNPRELFKGLYADLRCAIQSE